MLTEAGEAYRYLLQRALSLDGLDDALSGEAADPKVAELARACGRTLASAGDYDGAIDALLKGGLQAEAVPLLERAGRIEDAAKLELEAGNLQRAADLFEKAGEHRRADTVRARLALKAGKADKAAALLERSGDLERAAGLWAKSGDYARAASLHEQRREWLSAAQAWQRAKRPAKAAAALERLGDRRRAADLYRKIGDTASELRLRQAMKDHLSVARILLASGDEERAEEALRRVTEGDRGHRAACSLLGDLYRKRGRPSAATVRYRQAVQGTRPDERSAEVFYHLGCCAEEAREPDLAKAAWAALREWDPTYRDVEERFEAYRAPQTPDPVPPDFDPTEPVVMEELRALPDVSAMQELRSPSEVASGRYERMETLGAGGTSAVYRAKDKVLGREVALKVLVRLPGKEEVTAPDRFLREARSAAALNHPNIVTIFDFGEEQGDLYIAMEFVKGMTLRGMVREGGALGLPLIRSVLLQMCDALDYAHGEGLMHRDIKPANLMWTGGQRLKITDFGLAKLVRDDGSALMSKVLGTPYYMSPEQIRGQEIDPRTDLYSLGVSLYELATARVPFGKGDILKAHLRQRPASPGRYRDDMPQWLEDAILRCLAKEPGDRFPSARALRAAVPGASQG